MNVAGSQSALADAAPASSRRKRCLVVRPRKPEAAHGGDEIIYRRSIEYLSRTMDVTICELEPITKSRQILELIAGTPPEMTKFYSSANKERVSAAISKLRPDVACFFNEVTFPCLTSAKAAGINSVLVEQNVHSLIASSDSDWKAKLFWPLAIRFEKKYYGDESAELVCISRCDLEGLKRAGIVRKRVWIAPPGCPPDIVLADSAELASELVLTGSYAWWRKRRDLKGFAKGARLPFKMHVFDGLAREILGLADESPDVDWSAKIRFGLVTDRFVGGFKLKALEYVAKNCIVLTACDISPEFQGLPHADLFVRIISDKDNLLHVIEEIRREPDVVRKFREFKSACLAQYAWERCLAPLGEAVQASLSAARPA
ncbi:MAG: hypothetical protein EKK33_33710 [Bradyrhizobiaceae bacterium]|jgi:hypothetical protein|nr:MAG: hypothetical protein EKK33_33710 [Bradyrhizobiaceae bacterium]